MKKLFSILVVAVLLTACNVAADNSVNPDSTVVVTDTCPKVDTTVVKDTIVAIDTTVKVVPVK